MRWRGAFLALGLVFAACGAAAAGPADSAITVIGNRHIGADLIRSHFHAAPDGRLDAAALDAALKDLYATGLFINVKIAHAGDRVLVTVVENPTIGIVAFEGNKKIKDDDLKKEVQSKPGGPLARAFVQGDVVRIQDLYRQRGYFDVNIVPKTIEAKRGDDSRVNLVFEIKEGDKLAVRQVRFAGNTAFSETKLKAVVKTGVTNVFSFLLNNDAFDADRVDNDRDLLRRFYLAHGYADMRVSSATSYDAVTKSVMVTFKIDEGPPYRFGKVGIESSVKSTDAATLRDSLQTHDGDLYDADAVIGTVEALAIALAKNGEPFASVVPRSERRADRRLVDLVYVIGQGKRLYVERIEIHGNIKTRDEVIRREFDFGEGDAYNRALVDRGERHLKALGYFKTVKIATAPGSAPDRVVLDVTVEEEQTGSFFVSGGYSTTDGALAEVSISDKNFLGTGDIAKASVTYGQYARGFDLSFTDPWFLGQHLAVGGELFGRQSFANSYQSYNTSVYGARVNVGDAVDRQSRRHLELLDLQSGHHSKSGVRHGLIAHSAGGAGRLLLGVVDRKRPHLFDARQRQDADQRHSRPVQQRICRSRRRGQICPQHRRRPHLSRDCRRRGRHGAGAKRLCDAMGRPAIAAAERLLRRSATGARFCAERLWAARYYAGHDHG